MTTWVKYMEPWPVDSKDESLGGVDVEIHMSKEDAIKIAKAVAKKSRYIYPSDQQAFEDFLCINYATAYERPASGGD